ncbi:MAG: hypothetical protein AAF433_14960 [Bacteroidota bacterium]
MSSSIIYSIGQEVDIALADGLNQIISLYDASNDIKDFYVYLAKNDTSTLYVICAKRDIPDQLLELSNRSNRYLQFKGQNFPIILESDIQSSLIQELNIHFIPYGGYHVSCDQNGAVLSKGFLL